MLLALTALGGFRAPGQTPSIPTAYVLPSSSADATKPGFIWRISQVDSVGTYAQNSNARTEAQLAGLLGPNLADPTVAGVALAPANAPNPASAPLDFEIPTVINLDKVAGSHGNFTPDDQMPGAPGTNGGTDNQAAEILTWLDLPVGDISMGVNSDDGFRMTIGGATPNDHFAVNVGEFDGGRGAADTIFKFHIAQAGLYAARVIWENGGGDANIEWFSVQPDGTDILINDTNTPGAIKAYRAATVPLRPYAAAFSPGQGQVVSPDAGVNIVLVDGAKPVAPATVRLTLDGAAVTATVTRTNNQTTITYQPAALWPSASTHAAQLVFSDTGTPAQTTTNDWTFTAVTYRNIVLPQPLYLENFEEVALGAMPAGWTLTNNTDNATGTSDIGDPKSDAYLNWVVIDRNQVFLNGTNSFAVWEAGDPDGRVTHIAPGQVVNGKVLKAEDLMVGKFMYAESDERSGNQVQVAFTSNYDLTGKSNLWISYHSSYTQNQDSIASTEYSIDGGTNWLPVVYMLQCCVDGQDTEADVHRFPDGTVDAVTTLLTFVDSGAAYGLNYGAFIGAPITQALAPYISGRTNDDTVESHRVELYPLPAADNHSQVQFRFMQAGTGSWYWGVDEIGIYSIPPVSSPGNQPSFGAVVRNSDGSLTLAWTGGGTLQSAPAVTGPWQDVPGATSPYTLKPTGTSLFGRIKQ
jgi:hypothetical protein